MNRNPVFAVVGAGVRKFALPVLAACLLRMGVTGMILAVSRVASSWLAEFVNFIIRRGFPDTIEIQQTPWMWQMTTMYLVGGLLAIGLGLAAGQWAYSRRHPLDK